MATAETVLAVGAQAQAADDRNLVVVHVDLATLCDDDDGDCHLEDGPRLAPETARRLCCDASVVALIYSVYIGSHDGTRPMLTFC